MSSLWVHCQIIKSHFDIKRRNLKQKKTSNEVLLTYAFFCCWMFVRLYLTIGAELFVPFFLFEKQRGLAESFLRMGPSEFGHALNDGPLVNTYCIWVRTSQTDRVARDGPRRLGCTSGRVIFFPKAELLRGGRPSVIGEEDIYKGF